MPVDLPYFEGREVETLKLSVTGTIDDENAQPDRALKIGDTIVTVSIAQVVGVNHTEDKDGVVTRNQKIKVVEAHEVRGQAGIDLLDKARVVTTPDSDNEDDDEAPPTLQAVSA